jgi:ABC-type Fe3+/spermidine/putrescine transport system ATPase subunit
VKSSDNALEVENVHFSYGGIPVLRGVSFNVRQGEILMIKGPSGVGKSSLLRLIAGLETVQEGQIKIDGRVVSSRTFHLPPERRNIGMVFQDFALFPHLTVSQNVAFGLFRLSRDERATIVSDALRTYGLEDLANRFPAELSGGQQQRTALARSLVTKPRILLLDEPFSSLDPRLRVTMREDAFQLIRQLGVCAVYVSHEEGAEGIDKVFELIPSIVDP